MKKVLLWGTALSLSMSFANAQGITGTSAYDDFTGPVYTGATPGSGIFWWGGPDATASSRTGGKLTYTYSSASETNFVVDFGTSPETSPGAGDGQKLGLDLSNFADVEVRVENNSDDQLLMRVILEDNSGTQANIEPNVSDCVGVPDFDTPTPGLTWPADDSPVYPFQAFNGFALEPHATRTIRIDLSSVPSAIGGLTATTYGNTTPANSPNAAYSIDADEIHAVLFRFAELDDFHLSEHASDQGSYRFDTTVTAVGEYTGSIILHSFKIGNILSPLGLPTSVKTDAAVDGSLKVYPNPAKENLNVTFEAKEGAVVALTDMMGHTVYTATAVAGENKMNVNTSSFQKGIYILNISTESGKVARKVTIQ